MWRSPVVVRFKYIPQRPRPRSEKIFKPLRPRPRPSLIFRLPNATATAVAVALKIVATATAVADNGRGRLTYNSVRRVIEIIFTHKHPRNHHFTTYYLHFSLTSRATIISHLLVFIFHSRAFTQPQLHILVCSFFTHTHPRNHHSISCCVRYSVTSY